MTDSGSVTSIARSEPRGCPRCGTRGQSVDRLTVAAMMSGVVPPNQSYWLCREPGCEVVYSGEDATVLTAADMNVAPGFKSRAREALVCYCFQHRRGDIAAELQAAGRTSIADRIAAEVEADNCACEVRNPSGKCCLGDVRNAIQEISAELSVELSVGARS